MALGPAYNNLIPEKVSSFHFDAIKTKTSSWDGTSRTGYRASFAKMVKGTLYTYEFPLNPTSVSGGITASWSKKNIVGGIKPIASFLHMQGETSKFQLLFDYSDNTSSQIQRGTINNEFFGAYADLRALLSFMYPDLTGKDTNTAKGAYASPASMSFIIGPQTSEVIIDSVSWNTTDWFPQLVPKRITVDISLTHIAAFTASDIAEIQESTENLNKSMLITVNGSAATITHGNTKATYDDGNTKQTYIDARTYGA